MSHALTQGIRTINTSLSTKSATADKFYKKVLRYPGKKEGNQHQLAIFCQKFQIFCCKIEIVEKIK